MFCERCGTYIPEGNRFCTNCGTPLHTLPPVPPTSPVYAVPEPVYEPPRYRPPVEPVSKPATDYGSNQFLYMAPDLDETLDTPKPVAEPIEIPSLDPVYEQPVVAPAPEPVYEQPVVAAVQEPVYEQPVVAPVQEPVYEQPMTVPVANEYSYEVPVYNTPPATATTHRTVKKSSVGNKIISIIICLFMCISAIGAVASLTTGSLISKEYAEHIADNVDYDKLSEAGDKEYTKEDFKDVLSIEGIKNGDVKTAKTVASLPVMITCFVLFAVMAFLIFLVKKFKISAMLWSGISLFAAGLFYTLYGLIAPLLMDNGVAKILFEDFAKGKIMFNGLAIIVTAILIIVVYVVLRVIKNKKA